MQRYWISQARSSRDRVLEVFMKISRGLRNSRSVHKNDLLTWPLSMLLLALINASIGLAGVDHLQSCCTILWSNSYEHGNTKTAESIGQFFATKIVEGYSNVPPSPRKVSRGACIILVSECVEPGVIEEDLGVVLYGSRFFRSRYTRKRRITLESSSICRKGSWRPQLWSHQAYHISGHKSSCISSPLYLIMVYW